MVSATTRQEVVALAKEMAEGAVIGMRDLSLRQVLLVRNLVNAADESVSVERFNSLMDHLERQITQSADLLNDTVKDLK